jgi:AbrB family looped-hinge helix DNA binding protein
LSLTIKTKIGKKCVVVIPKAIAEKLKLTEGSIIKISIAENKIIIKPWHDAVWLSLHGEKIAQATLKELEEENLKQQEKYL